MRISTWNGGEGRRWAGGGGEKTPAATIVQDSLRLCPNNRQIDRQRQRQRDTERERERERERQRQRQRDRDRETERKFYISLSKRFRNLKIKAND